MLRQILIFPVRFSEGNIVWDSSKSSREPNYSKRT